MPSGVYNRDTDAWFETRMKISKALQTDNPSYTSSHRTVRKFRGTPSLCEHCGTTEGKFEWANASGNFKDIYDYIRLCTKCHAKFDPERWEKIYAHPDAFKEEACDVCGKVFRGSRARTQHKTKMHSKRKTTFCILCGQVCASQAGLAMHTQRVHTVFEETACDVCGRLFKSSRNMRHHYTKSHTVKHSSTSKKCFCILCGKVFESRQGLAAHRTAMHRVHTPVSCEICGKEFSSQRNLTHHTTRSHRKEA